MSVVDGVFLFLDCDAGDEKDIGAVKGKMRGKTRSAKRGDGEWYRDARTGDLVREELIVRGMALRAMVEVEWQVRRRKT